MIVDKTGTHLGTAPHLVQIFRQPQTRPNPLDEVQPADLAHMIRQPHLGVRIEAVLDLDRLLVVVLAEVHEPVLPTVHPEVRSRDPALGSHVPCPFRCSPSRTPDR